MVKVSVIIPVYNTEKYLERCLYSIIKQSLKEIEIICIDDKSTDNSLIKLKKIAKTDGRINIIINEKNYGAGISRNFGLKMSCGEYIHFVDSDDYLEPNALEKLYEKSKYENIDIYFHKMQIILSNEKDEWKISKGIEGVYSGCYKGTELLGLFVENNDFFYYPCLALYKRKFLIKNNCFFKQLLIGEGGEFILHALIYANRVKVDNEKFYKYFIHSQSITGNNKERVIIHLGQLIQFITILKEFTIINDDTNIYKYLKYQYNKIYNNINNLSNDEINYINKNLNNKFSRFILWQILYKNKEFGIDKKNIELMMKYKNVILYGAGNIVKYMLDIFNKYNINLKGIAVTDKLNNPQNLYGHSIYEISELKDYSEECLVVVALKKKYHNDVNKKLKEFSFKNITFIEIDSFTFLN